MEKKRKLPARAAARVEQMAKRRTKTPERLSETPAPSAPSDPESTSTPVAVQERPPPLPTSVQAGKPLPTVEDPQPEDLPAKDYQLVSERYVLMVTHHSVVVDRPSLQMLTLELAVVCYPSHSTDLDENGSARAYSRSSGANLTRERELSWRSRITRQKNA